MSTDVKPCEAPCPKCGSNDVVRTFYAKGTVTQCVEYGKSPFDCRWACVQYNYWAALKDFIGNHCRCCQYTWGAKPLRRKKAVKA